MSSVQYSVAAWMGGELGGECVYIMAESLCCPPETITALLTGLLQYKIKKCKIKIHGFNFTLDYHVEVQDVQTPSEVK